jgi:hypothetical protein
MVAYQRHPKNKGFGEVRCKTHPCANMDSSRPKRSTKKPKGYSQSSQRALQPAQLKRQKACRQAFSQALKPVAVEPILDPTILDTPQPTYFPPRQLQYKSGCSGGRW